MRTFYCQNQGRIESNICNYRKKGIWKKVADQANSTAGATERGGHKDDDTLEGWNGLGVVTNREVERMAAAMGFITEASTLFKVGNRLKTGKYC